jgi:hypothetical protein
VTISYPAIDEVTKAYSAEAAKNCSCSTGLNFFHEACCLGREADCDAVLARSFEVLLSQSQADKAAAKHEKALPAELLDYIEEVDYIGPKYAKIVGVNSQYLSWLLKVFPTAC